jgi:hypothetical protein
VTDRRADDTADDLLDEEGPGSDPGEAYRRASESDDLEPGSDEEPAPGVGDVYRSGS